LEGECLLYYQPQLDLQTGSLAGVEVLLRWHSPEQGWIPPDQFIPIAFLTLPHYQGAGILNSATNL